MEHILHLIFTKCHPYIYPSSFCRNDCSTNFLLYDNIATIYYEMASFVAMFGRVQPIYLKSCSDKRSSGNNVILKLMCIHR